MTLGEFKAWFEGYTENIDKAPTQKQWKRITERVGEIDGKGVTERVYFDRYWPNYYGPFYSSSTIPLSASSFTLTNSGSGVATSNTAQMSVGNFDSVDAMFALGAAEAAA